MKRNAPRVNNPARLARLRDQAIKLRERVKRSTLAFHERIQARLAWWQRAFRAPMVADWAIFTKAKTLLSAFMALLSLASGKKSLLLASMVEGPVPQAYRLQSRSSDILSIRKPDMRKANRDCRRLHVEGLEQRQLMATFQQSGSDLSLDLTAASTTLVVTAEASSYTLTLTGGDTWTSSNLTGATGSGSTTLIVTKDAFTTINVADSNTGAAVNFNNSAANTYTDNLSVVLDDATAGTITFAGTTSMTDSNTLIVSTARNILVNTGATVSTVNGNLTMQANQQATPTAGNFIGINVIGAFVQATGTGIVSVLGKGGDSDLSSQHGVRVASGGTISGVSTEVTGVAGGSGSINFNHGVYVFGSFSAITSSGGNVSVTGTGGGGTGTGIRGVGVDVENLAQIRAGGSGTVTVTGTGGTGTGGSNIGVIVGGATITSGGGNVSVVGTGGTGAHSGYGVFVGAYSTGVMNIEGRITAGGNGTVTVIGSGGVTDSSIGVQVQGQSGVQGQPPSSTDTPSEITSSGGDVTVTGTGGGTGTSGFCYGVGVNARITAGGTGTVTVTGTGGAGSGSLNRGVIVQTGTITSGGGSLSVTGVEGGGLSGTAIDVRSSGAITTATNGGTATVIGNSMNFDDTAVISAQSGSSVMIRQRTNGVAINLGTSGETVGGPLNLTDAELDRITAGTINIGEANSGAITFNADITRPTSTNVNLTTGSNNNIAFGAFSLNAGSGGDVSLTTSGTGAITTADNTDTDLTADDVTLIAGSNGIGTTTNFLRLAATSVTATTTSNGSINLVEADSVNIGDNDLNAGGGTISLGGGTFLTTATGSILSPATVRSGATVAGTGTTAAVTTQSGGSVAPGNNGPGLLKSGDVTLISGSTFAVEIGGTTPGNETTNYDQLIVMGSVSLGNATLTTSAFNSFVPVNANSFTIIENDGNDPIVGTFNGLAEGASISNFLGASGVDAVISYVGGSGNDVVLTVTIDNDFVYHAPLLQMGLDLDVFVLNSLDPMKAELVVQEHGTTNVLKQKRISEIDKLVDIKTAGKVYILTGLWTDGDEVSVTASNIEVEGKISTVNAGATDYGNITLIAQSKSNDIVSGITDALPIFADTRTATIALTNAQLIGGTIEIKTEGQSGARWDDVGGFGEQIAGNLLSQLQAIPQIALQEIAPITGQAKIHWAAANITLNNATINGQGDVTISADAFADASINTVSLGGENAAGLPVSISAAFSHSSSSATIGLQGLSPITALGNIKITTDAESKSKVVAKSDSNTTARGNGIAAAFNLALAMTEETSTITVSKDTHITSNGSIDIKSHAKVHNETKATTSVFQDGSGALTVAVSYDDANVKTEVHGQVTSQDQSTHNGFTIAPGNVVPDTRQIELKNVPPSQVVHEGDRLQFESDAAAGAYGLVPGETYTVESLTNSDPHADQTIDQSFLLRRGEIVALNARQVSEGSIHSLRTIALAEFGTSNVTTQADQSGVVTLKDLRQEVTRVTYRGSKFAVGGSEEGGLIGIEGLIQNQDYDIVKAGGDDQYYLRPVTKLATAIDNKPTSTIVAVNDISIFPLLNAADPTKDSFPFHILIGGEEMEVVSRSGNDLTVLRERNGTTIGNHAMDASVSTSSYAKFQVPTTLTPAQATQMHAFAYTANRQTFVPSDENVVDPKANTITFTLPTGHGFKTGDFVIYETDDAKTVEKEVYSYDKDGNRQNSLGKVNVPDAPIDGLEDYRGYRVIVDPNDPNLIRLSKQIQMEKVERDGSTNYYPVADTVVLNNTTVTGTHRLVPVNLVQGINISSSLEAENSSEAGTKLSDEEQPPSELVSQNLAGNITTSSMALIDGLREKATNNAVAGAADKAQTASGSRTNFDVAGSFALNIFQHDVATTIGSSAKLTSTSDLTVDGNIEQKTQLNAGAEATRAGVADDEAGGTVMAAPAPTTPPTTPPPDDSDDGDVEIAAAIAVGVYINKLNVNIVDGAVVNVADDLQVNAKVEYPLLSDSVLDAINPVKTLEENGLAGFEDILDGTGGLSQLFNVSVTAISGSEGDKVAFGGGIAVTYVTNEVTAEIGRNVNVNQPQPGASIQIVPDPTQSVTVTAELTAQVVEVGQQAAFNFNLDGAADAGEKLFSKEYKDVLSDLVVPFGVSGKKAIGGVMLLSIVDNKVKAKIHGSAQVAAQDSVSVDAKNAYSNVSVVQTGTASTDFGFTAAIAVGVFDLTTVASIDETVKITTGKLAVNAEDESDRIAIVGGFLKGEQVGIGTSIGVNIVDQQVDAFIGRAPNANGDTPSPMSTVPSTPTITAPDGVSLTEVTVTANTKGEIFALVMAGALQGSSPKRPEKPTATDTSSTTSTESKKLGPIALTIPVAVNVIDSDVRAYVDRQNFETESVTVEALSGTSNRQVVVGASFAVQADPTSPTEGKLTLGGAGAVALAMITQNTSALIQSSKITATDSSEAVTVKATDQSNSEIYAGGIGVAGSFTKGGKAAISFGASVAINEIDGATKAYIAQSQITASGAVNVNAIGNAKIFTLSIAGGVSANVSAQSSGAFAGGGTVSINDIEKTLEASIQSNTKLTVTANAPTIISATDRSEIFVIAGAVGIGVTASQGTAITGAIGIALSINDINNTIAAKLDRSTVDTGGDLTIAANSTDTIIKSVAVAASVGVSKATGTSVSLAGAGAGSLNDIGNTVSATMFSSQVTFQTSVIDPGSETGRLNVVASDKSTIMSYAIGASIGVAISSSNSVSVGFGASFGLNEIDNTVSATIDASNITLHDTGTGTGSLNVVASDKSSIESYAIGAAINAAIGSSTSVAVPIGFATGFNDINNTVQAIVKANSNLTLDPTNIKKFDVNIRATQEATINSKAIAASVGAAVGQNGVAVSIAGALSKNEISNTTLAKIVGSTYAMNGSLKLKAEDISIIDSLATGATIAGAVGNSAAVGVAIGGATGFNKTTNMVSATIEASNITLQNVGPGTGTLDVLASNTSIINSKAIGAAVSAAVSPGSAGVAVPIGVSLGHNTIKNTVEAVIKANSKITQSASSDQQFDVNVAAKHDATIKSTSVAGSVGVGASGTAGVAVSIAAALAKNEISNQTLASIAGSTLSLNGNLNVTADEISKIESLATGASISAAVGGTAGVAVSIAAALANNDISNQTLASIVGSTLSLNGNLKVTADEVSTIESLATGPSISAAVGGTAAVGVTIGGADGTNDTENTVSATIDASSITLLDPGTGTGTLDVMASDKASIKSTAIGAAIGASVGGTAGVAVSIGIATGFNNIHNTVDAVIKANSRVNRGATSQKKFDVNVTATQESTIATTATAAAVGVGVGGTAGVAVSGAGAAAKNKIDNKTLAHIESSTLSITGSLKVTASDKPTIDGNITAASVAVGGGIVGVGVALGVSYAENIIPATALTQAKISGGQFTVDGSVAVDASSAGTMKSNVNAVSIGFAAGVGGAAAGAAVYASHELKGKVDAQIVGLGTTLTKNQANLGVTVNANNNVHSNLDVLSASVAAAAGGFATFSVGVSSATTTLEPSVSAKISSMKLTSSGGNIVVTAEDNVTVTNEAATASVAVTLGQGFAIAGGGSSATVTATPKVVANVLDSELIGSNVTVSANSTDTIDAESKAAAIGLAFGFGLGAAGSISSVTLEPTVKSEVIRTNVVSTGTMEIHAQLTPIATAESAGLAVSTGASVGLSSSTVTIGGLLASSLDASGKSIQVGALKIHSDNNAAPTGNKINSAIATGASGGLLIGANGAIAKFTNRTKTIAEISDNTGTSARINVTGKTEILSNSATSQTAQAGSLAAGLLSSGNTLTESNSNNENTAHIGKNVRLTSGALDLQSISVDQNVSTTKVGSFGGIAAALSRSDTNTTSVTQAIIDDRAALTISGAIDADAKHTSKYNTKLSALGGGLISGAGGAILNQINSTVNVIFGNSTVVSAGRMDATATNNVQKVDDPADKNNVDAMSGGIFAGVGMKHDTELKLNTATTIGDLAKISLTAKEDNPSTFAAIQDITIEDRVKFTAGGLATGGIVATNITSHADNISVTVGKNAQIDAKTPIHFSANENANVAIQANAETLGVVSGTGNKAKIDLRPMKSVKIDTGAKITSTKDLALLAGMTPGSVATSDSYTINNYVDSVAISLIPLDDLAAESSLQQTNTIDVLAGANVRSGGNILMYADNKDAQPVSAQAKGTNWVSGLKTVVGSLFSDTEGGVGESTGKKTSTADATVTVAGTVETGLGRHQTIVIEKIENPNPSDFKVVLSHTIMPESFGVFRDSLLTVSNITKDPNYPVSSDFSQRFDYVKAQLRRTDAEPEQLAFYERELEQLRKQMQTEGLHTSHPNVEDISVTGKTLNLVIPDLSASSGAIRIIADTGKLKDELGTLNAPSDPSITITNKTFAYITTSKLSIPEHNGGVFINGVLRPGFATKPKILVDNKINSTQLGENFWPGIVAQGLIDNLSGDVTLKNVSTSGGQIKIPGDIRSATQTIDAGLFGIVDINRANGQGLFEVGGAASSQILKFTDGAGPVLNETDALAALTKIQEQPAIQAARITIKASHINLNSLIKSGETNFTFEFTDAMEAEVAGFPNGSKDQVLTTNTNKAFTVVVNVDEKGEREIVLTSPTPSGGYVNIDGHIANTGGGEIQVASGYSNVTITGNSRFPIKLQGIDLSKRAVGRLIINDRITDNNRLTTYESNGDTVYKNFGTGSSKELKLNSQDQYMPEEGLRYGFSVVEQTIKKTTTTYNEKAGKVSKLLGSREHQVGDPIVDPAPPNEPERKLHQEGFYFYVDKAITNKDFDYRKLGPNIKTGNPVESEHKLYDCGFFEACLDYYYWTKTEEIGTTTYNDHSIRADRPINIKFSGLNEPKLDVVWGGAVIVDGSIGTDRSVTNLKADKLVTTENGLIRGQTINLTASQFGSSSKSKIDPTETLELRTDLADNVYFDYLLDDHIREGRPAVTVYRGERVLVGNTHTEGGSPGIVYEFIGAPPITKQLSTVNYSDKSQWREITNNIAMNVTSTDTSGSLDNSVKIFEVTGDMLLGSITTHGNTWLHSAGGILSATNGGSIQIDPSNFSNTLPAVKLTADSGDIGTSAAPINILTTWQTSFKAFTPGNIFLHSKKDLAVDQIEAKGHVTVEFDPGFSMIDVDFHDEVDVRGIDEQIKIWENLQLKDTGFETKRNTLISDLEVINTTQYRTYWKLRNQTPNPSNYTSSVRVALSQGNVADLRPTLEHEGRLAQKTGGELEQYIRDAVKKIEGERTDELHRLHKVVGTLTPAFDSNYKHQATPAEKKQIDDSMHKWTEEELRNLRNASFVANFLKITDTELVVEQPNIIGESVTIKHAYGVGTYDHGQTIQLRDTSGNRTKLNLDQRAAVISAESNDLIFITQKPVAVVVSVQDNYKLKLEGYTQNQDAPYGASGKWSDLGFEVGQSIMLAGDPGSTTDRGVFYKVKSISPDGLTLEVDSVMTDGSPARPVKTRPIGSENFRLKEFGEYLIAPVITDPVHINAPYVYVLRREDVDVESVGKIEVNATSNIFIGSEGNMLLGNIQLPKDSTGTIQIKANDDLRRSSNTQILGNVVLLESANGMIGAAAQRLRIGKQGEAILRAKGDIHAESSDQSALQVKNIYSTGKVDLTFHGGFVDLGTADVAIRAEKINLITDNSLGDIGKLSVPFTIDGKTITGTGKNLYLKSTGNVIIGAPAVSTAGGEGEILPDVEGLFASGDLRLESLGSITILGTMSAGGTMFVSAKGQLIAIPESRVLSNGPVTLVLHSLAGSSSPAKLDFLGQLTAPSTVIQGSDGPDEFRLAPAASSSGEVQMAIDRVDSIDYGTQWKAERPTVRDSQFLHVLSSGAQKLLVKNSVLHTNPILPFDVNADGSVSAIDVLIVINYLNRRNRPDSLASDGPMSSQELALFMYYDVTADGIVAPLDILRIINVLKTRGGSVAQNQLVKNSVVHTNPILPFDVNADGSVGPIDALIVLNLLNRRSRPDRLASDGSMISEEPALSMYYDVDADGNVSPLDVLKIINFLNTREGSAEGEFVATSSRRNDLLIGGSAESQDDLASRDAVLADSGSDWALSLFDLGDVDDDDQEDDLRGELGIDMFFGAFGDKFI